MKLFSKLFSNLNMLEEHFKLEFNLKNELQYSIIVNEHYGTYNGQIKLAILVSKYIFKRTKLTNDKYIKYVLYANELKSFENIFFDKLIVTYNESCYTNYDMTSEYNDETKKFNQIKIFINSRENKTYNDILVSLVHELTHAREDYNRRIKDDKLSLYNTLSNSNYKELISHINSFNDFSDLCAKILYMFKRFEKNAYISELSVALHNSNKKINNYKDALDVFYNTETYKEYYILYEAFKKFYNENDFIKYYKNHIKNISPNKIYKILNNQFINIFNKISSIVPKLYYKYSLESNKNEINNKLIKPFNAFNEQLVLLLNK